MPFETSRDIRRFALSPDGPTPLHRPLRPTPFFDVTSPLFPISIYSPGNLLVVVDEGGGALLVNFHRYPHPRFLLFSLRSLPPLVESCSVV